MAKFRKRPVEVEAFQFTGQPPREWPHWAKDHLGLRYENTNVQVDTNHGTTRASIGDWILLRNGEVYPCRKELFAENYEVVDS